MPCVGDAFERALCRYRIENRHACLTQFFPRDNTPIFKFSERFVLANLGALRANPTFVSGVFG